MPAACGGGATTEVPYYGAGSTTRTLNNWPLAQLSRVAVVHICGDQVYEHSRAKQVCKCADVLLAVYLGLQGKRMSSSGSYRNGNLF